MSEVLIDFTTPPLYPDHLGVLDEDSYRGSPPVFVCVVRGDSERYDVWYGREWTGRYSNSDDGEALVFTHHREHIALWGWVTEIAYERRKFNDDAGDLLQSGLNAAYIKGLTNTGFAGVVFLTNGEDGLTRYKTGPDGMFELGHTYVLVDISRWRGLFEINYLSDYGVRRRVAVPPGSFEIVAEMLPAVTPLRPSLRQIQLES